MDKHDIHAAQILPRYYLDGQLPIPDGYWAMMPSERGLHSSFPADRIRIQDAIEYAESQGREIRELTADELLSFVDEYKCDCRDNDIELDNKIADLVSYLLRDDVPLSSKKDDSNILNWLLELRMYRRANRGSDEECDT